VPEVPPPGNAWAPFVDGWLAGLTVGTLLLLIASTRAVAGDREAGLLRVASTRSASRAGLVLGRALLGVVLTLGALLVAGLGAWIAATLLYQFGPVIEDNYELVSSEELHAGLRLALLATVPPLLTTWFFGLFVSSVTRSGTGAVAVGLATYLGFDLFKEVLGEAQYYAFAAFNPSFVDNSCLNEFADVARGFSDAGYSELRYIQNLWMPWPQALLLVVAACVVTRRRPL
jgi:ABC-type transport system involved in multi-copper enzyme maturation permease subunit